MGLNLLCGQASNISVNMPELGRFWADAATIGPEPAQFWHITAFLQGMRRLRDEYFIV